MVEYAKLESADRESRQAYTGYMFPGTNSQDTHTQTFDTSSGTHSKATETHPYYITTGPDSQSTEINPIHVLPGTCPEYPNIYPVPVAGPHSDRDSKADPVNRTGMPGIIPGSPYTDIDTIDPVNLLIVYGFLLFWYDGRVVRQFHKIKNNSITRPLLRGITSKDSD